MYRASDRVDNEAWIELVEEACVSLDLDEETRSTAVDLFLSRAPEDDRGKRVAAAASLYAAGLIRGEERSQSAVADAMDVSRLSVQKRWKPILEDAGFSPPSW
ncbi:transcription initiation factor IIB family protein [Halorubrum sp. Atlit-26R]|uniref:transcription initiation factor IIB family protein n=1 Tax=Halorubrum sp. Atlit-26R TaxID=2282128 RepID=UPI000EF1F97C|nr:transcription initiation factor IIB family protein [Halorubrum sp. Atlit-26R]RLM72583.1 transcription initiation factor IIB family protein [Halorubrum sp. Atlit-26R]